MIDDFLFIGDSKAECERVLAVFEHLCEFVRLLIAPAKTERPTKALTFLGYSLDTISQTVSIPQEKVAKYARQARELAAAATTTPAPSSLASFVKDGSAVVLFFQWFQASSGPCTEQICRICWKWFSASS